MIESPQQPRALSPLPFAAVLCQNPFHCYRKSDSLSTQHVLAISFSVGRASLGAPGLMFTGDKGRSRSVNSKRMFVQQ